MNRISKAAWEKREEQEATDAFSKHICREIGRGHWRLYREGTIDLWVDLVVLGSRNLCVWGDICGGPIVFAYGPFDPPERVVSWVAGADIHYYGPQKACIGNGGDAEGIYDYVEEVAASQIEEEIKEGTAQDEKYKMVLEEALTMVGERYLEDVVNFLLDSQVDAEWLATLGRVTSNQVIWAICAARKLWELLKE